MNIIIGQSGGPTAVINSSLTGVAQAAIKLGAEKVFGMIYGIEGFLEGKIFDMTPSLQSSVDVELIRRTASSHLGSCRYQLPSPSEDENLYRRIFTTLEELDIRYFFYIGGNDSMDTVLKLSQYAKAIQSPIGFMGVPKSINNDLLDTDHTPGYGSAAKYIAVVMKELVRDETVYNIPSVTTVEIMGRDAGWLTAAAALAKGDDCEGVDMLCLPEVPFQEERFLEQVDRMVRERRSMVIAVGEGIRWDDGRYVCQKSGEPRHTDSFGHINLNGAGRYLASRLNRALGVKSRCIELSVMQRCATHMVSLVDSTEAYQVGTAAVKAALEGHTGEMIVLKRLCSDPYQCITDYIPVERVVGKVKKLPLHWIQESQTAMTKEYLQYALPLIQGEFPPFYVDGLTRHIHRD